ncbi:MAG: glycosyltransferase family 2 protein [SAR324 cluster bacterium]|uniref:Glycosyltransferase family 2 protein n=1 Tax=SAR324 cluster bacterium TaxID=2024889 RepID=A0A7X9ILM3_9DELT|nr:glycosyltransferase family 2 protein [SAR324 cluster bacterium]
MNVFVMISTAASGEYTVHALRSFFANTPLADKDTFYLIDNDKSLRKEDLKEWPRVNLCQNPSPYSFAKNANKAIELALEKKGDLFLLNNDIIFCENWLEPLLIEIPVIISAISNQYIQYTFGDLTLRPCMDLSDYLNYGYEFNSIIKAHHSKQWSYRQVLSAPFFCVRIPKSVFQEVGNFDCSFGKGGAEDNDYCLRAYLQGFGVFLSLDSYVLHFQGKSTWRGPESKEDTEARNKRFLRVFAEKWGKRLQRLMIFNDESSITKKGQKLLQQNRISAVLKTMASKTQKGKRLKNPKIKIAAVMCVYDDCKWLEAAVKSVYEKVDSIYFMVGNRPWNGEKGSNKNTLEKIASIKDPRSKFKLIKGKWSSETEERNAGLEALKKDGFDYCFVLDSDEVYDKKQLAEFFKLITEKRYVPAWRIRMLTYWKSEHFRIEPPEAYQPVVVLKVGDIVFRDKREISSPQSESIPPELCVMHHMSYARSDNEILRKISTFSHADQMIPNWYENVWKAWDENMQLRNLHPCWPDAYQEVVGVPEELLPSALRSRLRRPKK